jgi:hypothetical protein
MAWDSADTVALGLMLAIFVGIILLLSTGPGRKSLDKTREKAVKRREEAAAKLASGRGEAVGAVGVARSGKKPTYLQKNIGFICTAFTAVRLFPPSTPSTHAAPALFHRAPHTAAIRCSLAVRMPQLRQGPQALIVSSKVPGPHSGPGSVTAKMMPWIEIAGEIPMPEGATERMASDGRMYGPDEPLYRSSMDDAYYVAFCIIGLTALRAVLFELLLKPLGKLFHMQDEMDIHKFAENGWQSIYYGTAWATGLTIHYNSSWWFGPLGGPSDWREQLWSDVGGAQTEHTMLMKLYYRPGPPVSPLSVLHSKLVLYGGFVWVRGGRLTAKTAVSGPGSDPARVLAAHDLRDYHRGPPQRLRPGAHRP